MGTTTSRRGFLQQTATTSVLFSIGYQALASEEEPRLKKSLIGNPDRATLEAHKAAGFHGIESNVWDIDPEEAAQAKAIADSLGMKIHSVMRGWTNFNNPDPEVVRKDIESVKRALRAAAAYGADAVLLVPCRIGGMKIPEPWEFDIQFDEKTGHVRRVVDGDNTPYQDYIKAHNESVDASRKAVEQLIPEAEKCGVLITLENVWNNLWVKPAIFAHFVASFQNRWVQAYYDIGNHVRYALPEEWLQALGSLIKKLHIKDFLLNPDGRGGKFVPIREGSVNWPKVRKLIDEIGYTGWLTIEGSGELSLEERSKRLDLIIAGK